MSKPKVSREEKMSMIQEKLENGVRAIFESENYKDYIRTMAKFPNYSINNCILIASQRPDASYVCGIRGLYFCTLTDKYDTGDKIPFAPEIINRRGERCYFF